MTPEEQAIISALRQNSAEIDLSKAEKDEAELIFLRAERVKLIRKMSEEDAQKLAGRELQRIQQREMIKRQMRGSQMGRGLMGQQQEYISNVSILFGNTRPAHGRMGGYMKVKRPEAKPEPDQDNRSHLHLAIYYVFFLPLFTVYKVLRKIKW